MSRRVPFLVAVVGVLLVGGAATGTTGATWTGQQQLSSNAVGSGAMSFTTTTPAGVTVLRTATSSATTSFVLDDTSNGKNLRQRVTAQVAGTPTGVTATVGTSCPGAASVQVDTTPTSADVTLCVRVASSLTAVSGTVTLNVSGAQQPSGWSTPVSTVSVPVTVSTATAPAAPVLSCNSPTQNGFRWAAVTGAVDYVVTSSSSQTGPYTDVVTQTQLSYLPTLGGNTTTFWRVRATNAAGSSAASNTVRLTRTGNSYTCATVTP